MKWNEIRESIEFWDPNTLEGRGAILGKTISDKSLVNNPSQAKYDDILAALCRVVSELIEIEETRLK